MKQRVLISRNAINVALSVVLALSLVPAHAFAAGGGSSKSLTSTLFGAEAEPSEEAGEETTVAENFSEELLDSDALEAAEVSLPTDWATCGTCEWMIDADGKLTVRPLNGAATGTLEHWSYSYFSGGAPWYDYGRSIESATIEQGVVAQTCAGMFDRCTNLTTVNLTGLDISSVTSMGGMFDGCTNLISVNLTGLDTSSVTYMSDMFDCCTNLTTVDLTGLDTSSVTNMSRMFYRCTNLTTVDLTGLDTSSVTNMSGMFSDCSSLISLDLTSFDTSSIPGYSNLSSSDLSCLSNAWMNMNFMFGGCSSLTSVTLGDKFSFNGAGTKRLISLPTPSGNGHTGKWISSADGKAYGPDEIPNNVAATYTAEGPEAVTPKGTDKAAVASTTKLSSDTITFGYNADGEVDVDDDSGKKDSDTEKSGFFPGSWNLKSAVIPCSVERTTYEDGTYKDKIALGLLDDSKLAWNKYKELFEDMEKGAKADELAEAFEAPVLSVSKFSLLPKVSIAGYREITYDKNGNVIADTGNVSADAKWKASSTWQFYLGPVPMYLKGTGSAKLSGKLKLIELLPEQKLSGSVSLTPKLEIEAGAGISGIATIGGGGSAALEIGILPKEKRTGTLTAEAKVHAYLVFVVDKEWSVAKKTVELWDCSGNSASSVLSIEELEDAIETSTVELSRDYLNDVSAWNGGESGGYSTLSSNDGTITTTDLLSGLMTTSMPRIMQVGNTSVMVFQSDDASRDSLNRSVLKYSVLKDGAWSEPQSVWDTGTLDGMADLQVIDGTLYATWQKENATITSSVSDDGSSTLSQMSDATAVAVARFDEETGTFTDTQYVTDTTHKGFMPELVKGASEPTVVWVENSENDMLQQTGTNKIMSAVRTDSGTWSVSEVGTSSEPISTMEGFMNNGNVEVAYVASLESGTELRLASTSSVVEANDTSVINALSANTSSNAFSYVSNGVIKNYDLSSGATTAVSSEEESVSSEAIIAKNMTLWSSSTEEGGHIYASTKLDDGTYSTPVEVYSTDGKIFSLDSAIDESGNVQCVMNVEEDGVTKLRYATLGSYSELSITSAMSSGCIAYDKSYEVTASLENTGLTTLSGLTAKLVDETGRWFASKALDEQLAPGEQMVLDEAFIINSTSIPSSLSLVITANEGNVSSEPYALEVSDSYLDLATSTSTDGSTYTITAQIANKAAQEAQVVFHVYSGSGEDTKEIATSDPVTIESSKIGEASVSIPKESIPENADGLRVLTYSAEVVGSEASYLSDNTFVYELPSLKGDVNDNGILNIVDVQLAYDIATTDIYKARADYAAMFTRADVDGDGTVDAKDARAIQYAALRGW